MALIFKAGLEDAAPNTVAGVLNQIEAVLPAIEKTYSLENVKYREEFNIALKEMQTKEQVLFDAYNIHNGDTDSKVKQLEQRILNCKKIIIPLSQMSGPKLWNVIAPSVRKTDQQEQQFAAYMQKYLEEKGISQDIVGQELGAYIIEGLNEALKESGVSSRHRVYSTRRFENSTQNNILMRNLTEAQKRAAKTFVKWVKTSKDWDIESIETKQTSWTEITSTLTQKEAKEISEADRIEIMQKLITYLHNQGLIDSDNILEGVVREVFSEKEFRTFFIGRNIIDGITGLLGEIQGLFIFRYLFRGRGNPKKKIKWVGGLDNPHEDLIFLCNEFKEGMGVQVKNTTTDATTTGFEKSITFASRTVDSFFQLTDITPYDQSVLTQIYEMDAFNIEYVVDDDGKTYVAGSNSTFAPLRQRILNAKKIADKIFAIFADTLMYMSTARAAQKLGSSGNIVWLLGGARIFVASQLWLDLQKQLKEGNLKFEITPSYESGDKNVNNIVEYMNKYHTHQGRNSAMGKLTLTTSYVFA